MLRRSDMEKETAEVKSCWEVGSERYSEHREIVVETFLPLRYCKCFEYALPPSFAVLDQWEPQQ